MKRISEHKEKKKISLASVSKRAAVVIGCVLALIIILGGVLVGAFFALRASGRHSMRDRREEQNTVNSDIDYDPGVVLHKGKKYRYNENVTSIMFVGIDIGEKQETFNSLLQYEAELRAAKNGTDVKYELQKYKEELVASGQSLKVSEGGGQADVILLVAVDEEKNRASVISVDRNSMSSYEVFDRDGNSVGFTESQLALSFFYGDGEHKSCEMTKNALSEFLCDIPIHAYYSMKTDAIAVVNDAVGGVEVTVPCDMTAANEAFTNGKRIKLRGDMAKDFLRARQGVGDGSNAERVKRQEQYIRAFVSTALEAVKKDLGLPKKLFEAIADNSFTDLGVDEAVYLADLALRLDISYRSIAGEAQMGDVFEEFNADKEALLELVLDIFYICED
ncbi:MAG: LCP family protein [Clostridia bacterium]|nr:LCP family protein [Clostridia bacterium]